jgi:antitoxin PrlF
MPVSTLTSKGRITIPKEICDRLGLRTGQRMESSFGPEGQLVLKPRTQDIRLLKGIIRSGKKRAVSVERMNEAIAEGFSKT